MDELSEEDKLAVTRARKIQRFLSQPGAGLLRGGWHRGSGGEGEDPGLSMANTIHIDIVSAEGEIHSGPATISASRRGTRRCSRR
jgi:hypothetical protein